MREVNYKFDNLKRFREKIEFDQEFEQDIEIWRALVEVEIIEESTVAFFKIGKETILKVREGEFAFTSLSKSVVSEVLGEKTVKKK